MMVQKLTCGVLVLYSTHLSVDLCHLMDRTSRYYNAVSFLLFPLSKECFIIILNVTASVVCCYDFVSKPLGEKHNKIDPLLCHRFGIYVECGVSKSPLDFLCGSQLKHFVKSCS